MNHTASTSALVELRVPLGTIVDRMVMQEDQTQGEAVLAYTVFILPPGGFSSEWVWAGDGQAVGNKRIHFFAGGPVPAQAVRVIATALIPGAAGVAWANVAVYSPCQ